LIGLFKRCLENTMAKKRFTLGKLNMMVNGSGASGKQLANCQDH
jgi:hypothetical protein